MYVLQYHTYEYCWSLSHKNNENTQLPTIFNVNVIFKNNVNLCVIINIKFYRKTRA